MAKNPYKFIKPKLDVIGWIPAIYPTRESVRTMNKMHQTELRYKRGMDLVLLESAWTLIEFLNRNKVSVMDIDYISDLEVGLVDLGRDGSAVVIYTDHIYRIQERDHGDHLVYFDLQEDTSAMLRVMSKYEPWPVALIPFTVDVESTGYRPIIRRVSPSEVDYNYERIMATSDLIERELNGVRSAESRRLVIRDNENNLYRNMVVDLMSAVIDVEFGIGGEFRPTWRPSLRELQDTMDKINKKFLDYLLDGKESRFNIPEYSDMSDAQLPAFNKFQKLIVETGGLR